jgi:hypothetical protein
MTIGNREIDATGKAHVRFIAGAKPGQPDITWIKVTGATGLYSRALHYEAFPGSGPLRVEVYKGRRTDPNPSYPNNPALFVAAWSMHAEWNYSNDWTQGEGIFMEWNQSAFPTTTAEEGANDTITVVVHATGNRSASLAVMLSPGS